VSDAQKSQPHPLSHDEFATGPQGGCFAKERLWKLPEVAARPFLHISVWRYSVVVVKYQPHQLLTHTSAWLDDLPDRFSQPAKPLPTKRLRVLIVGAGLMGSATGLRLVERGVPADEILIVDGAAPGFGASGRNAGFVLSFPGPELLTWVDRLGKDRTRRVLQANRANRAWVREFHKKRGLNWVPGGSYYIPVGSEEIKAMGRVRKLLTSWDMTDYKWLEEPPQAFKNSGLTLWQPQDGGIHPIDYVVSVLESSGVDVFPHTPVTWKGIQVRPGFVRVQTDRGAIEADQLVLATNAYTAAFRDAMNMPVTITPARNHVLLVEPDKPAKDPWGTGVYYSRYGFDYWRCLPNGTWLVGGGRDKDLEKESTGELEENDRIMSYLTRELLPQLFVDRDATIRRTWQGTLGMTPHELPVVAPWPNMGGRVWFAGGFSGYGLGLHRAVAEDLVGSLIDGTNWEENTFAPVAPPPDVLKQ